MGRKAWHPGAGNAGMNLSQTSGVLATNLIMLENSSQPLPTLLFIEYRLRASSPSGTALPIPISPPYR